ncbi:MAG TPA: hypothetical protein VNV41_16345 [Candidatus Acidoferrales bacterium]|jgi:hypothetical protein|nr:hypothetical protein [Candidatus Acidoferrales bacterium]
MPNRKKKEATRIVRRYGTMWARNEANIAKTEKVGFGVYVLFDGSMPMYVGKGEIYKRVKEACRSRRRQNLWDHFSWYSFKNARLMHDIEVLMLRILPPNLRSLTRQGGNFVRPRRVVKQDDPQAIPITRKVDRRK